MPYRNPPGFDRFELGYVVKGNFRSCFPFSFNRPLLAGFLTRLDFNDFQGAFLDIPAQAVAAQTQKINGGHQGHAGMQDDHCASPKSAFPNTSPYLFGWPYGKRRASSARSSVASQARPAGLSAIGRTPADLRLGGRRSRRHSGMRRQAGLASRVGLRLAFFRYLVSFARFGVVVGRSRCLPQRKRLFCYRFRFGFFSWRIPARRN